MQKMTRDEVVAWLAEEVHVGHLATVREDGRPHVATIWYTIDGDDVVFTTYHSSVKGRNLQRDGRAAMSVCDDVAPFTNVTVEGTVTMIDDPAQSHFWAGELGARYMGAEQREAFAARNGVPGEWVCRMTIARVTGARAVAG
jgi:PPOX class probable F420-dependent enzyme